MNVSHLSIIEIPARDIFPVRYSILRADGMMTHPTESRAYVEGDIEALRTIESDPNAGEYVVVKREKKSHPWKKVGTVLGTCQASANDNAWFMGLTVSQQDWQPLERVLHASAWAEISARQTAKSKVAKARA